MLRPLVICCWFILGSSVASALAQTSPERAAETLHLEPGLRVELVAAEPLVVSPVALAFDELGRAYVAENRGYPTGPAAGEPPAGRIALLEDTNDDGHFDRRHEFATDLTFPNGVLPWRGGLIVTCAPDILFLQDTDGDGQADERKVLLTGFSTAGSTQLRVSHPTLGPDGWIYVTSGLTGGKISNPQQPQRPAVELKRTDLRFRPDTGEFEAADGGSQFGMTFDDGGQRFICYNRVQAQHVVTAAHYWRRNPRLAFSDTVQNCPTDLAPEPLRGHGRAARLYPLSSNVTTADSHAGTFTAACGVTVWRGNHLPAAYRGGIFSCDPTGNLVHFDRLIPQGATFTAERAANEVEFLASTDNWFRPVYLTHGPDGGLYICDMYRKTIEHPDYLPAEIRKHTDFTSGQGMGRIWRVVSSDIATDTLISQRRHKINSRSSAVLVPLLKDADGWRRETAFRLLLESVEKFDVRLVSEVLAAPPNAMGTPPAAPLLALSLLARRHEQTADVLTDEVLSSALSHFVPAVRAAALPLIEPKLRAESMWRERVVLMANDPDPRVRFQVALALGELDSPAKVGPLTTIAVRQPEDRWLRAAVFSSLGSEDQAFLASLLSAPRTAESAHTDLFYELGRLLGAGREPTAVVEVLRVILVREQPSEFSETAALLVGLAESLRNRGLAKDAASIWQAVLPAAAVDLAPIRAALAAQLRQALAIAGDTNLVTAPDQARRRVALQLLATSDFASSGAALLNLIQPRESSELQVLAIRALGLMTHPDIAAQLLAADRFPAYTPVVRDEVLAALLASSQHHAGLLQALEQNIIPLGAIDTLRRKTLLESRDPEIQRRARQLYQSVGGADRLKVYEELKPVVSLASDPAQGQLVFKRACAACHRLDQAGIPVGPDLFGIRNQTKEAILLHIIIPEQEITPGFAAYVVTTKDGRVLTGILAAESPTSVTLRQAQGKEDTILREDIEELVASRLSLMPQELEKNVSRQEFADLLAYLKGERK
ncbi:MAG: PVC-type heme-binding CxxCH protein [Planctomycetota bacterium]